MVSIFLANLLGFLLFVSVDGTDVQKDLLKREDKRSACLLSDMVKLLVEEKREREKLMEENEAMKKAMKKMKKSLTDIVTGLSNKSSSQLQDIQDQLDVTKQSVTAQINDSSIRYNDIQTQLSEIRNQSGVPTNKVAFYADLTNDLNSLGRLHTIVFDNVRTNIGSGYNKNNGIFTAPVAGTYVFSWTVMAPPNKEEVLEIVIDGNFFARSFATDQDSDSYSKTVVMDLKEGNEVWIRTRNYRTQRDGYVTGSSYTSFTGWLLYPIN